MNVVAKTQRPSRFCKRQRNPTIPMRECAATLRLTSSLSTGVGVASIVVSHKCFLNSTCGKSRMTLSLHHDLKPATPRSL